MIIRNLLSTGDSAAAAVQVLRKLGDSAAGLDWQWTGSCCGSTSNWSLTDCICIMTRGGIYGEI